MAHDEIQARADLTAAPVTLQHKLGTLEQQRRLRSVFLGRELLQPPVQIFGYTQIHRHSFMVPNQYQTRAIGKSLHPMQRPQHATEGPTSAFRFPGRAGSASSKRLPVCPPALCTTRR